jgi:two-component system, NarL family, response regulator DegU
LFTESKAIRTILWGQRFNLLPIDQLIPNNIGSRVNSARISSRESLIEQAFITKPDLLIFEAEAPGERSWSQLLGSLKSKLPNTGFIAIVNEVDANTIQDLLMSQIDGIVKQDRVHLELPYAIRSYQKSEIFINPQVTKWLCCLIQNKIQSAESSSNPSKEKGLLGSLTNRELEVLACLTQGLNYKAIAKRLFVSDSTVKTHVNNIFTKLNVNDRTQAVLYGLRHGIDQMATDIFQRIEASHAPTA